MSSGRLPGASRSACHHSIPTHHWTCGKHQEISSSTKKCSVEPSCSPFTPSSAIRSSNSLSLPLISSYIHLPYPCITISQNARLIRDRHGLLPVQGHRHGQNRKCRSVPGVQHAGEGQQAVRFFSSVWIEEVELICGCISQLEVEGFASVYFNSNRCGGHQRAAERKTRKGTEEVLNRRSGGQGQNEGVASRN